MSRCSRTSTDAGPRQPLRSGPVVIEVFGHTDRWVLDGSGSSTAAG